ncbi:DUF3265 domain-containing protein [Vibrio alginolyticus]|nr:DUF3265 domain-containing protein [Vibrio alginolyticus]HCH0355191.1 DUF3265 domain-containing protein [Vibrio parahaemolyticus]
MQHVWHFWYALILVFEVVCSDSGLVLSHP